MTTPTAGDRWSIALTSSRYAGRSLCIGCNTTTGFVDNLLKIAASGSLQVGGYEAGMKPWVSCCINGEGGVSYNCGQKTVTASRNDEGRYTVNWGTSHPLGTNYVPILKIENSIGFIYHSDQDANKLVVIIKDTTNFYMDWGFYLLIT